MALEIYLIFFVTTFLLILVPGPSAITAASQGANHGHKLALWGVFGIAVGDALFFLLSATGIAALLLASSSLFTVIKWLGVAYLFYLGLSAIFSKSRGIGLSKKQSSASSAKLFGQGLIVQLANPKALMYFSALLPQFIDINEPLAPQLLIMGLTCFIADILVYSMFALFGDRLAKGAVKDWMLSLINKLAGGFLIFVGIKMASLETQA